MDNLNNNNFPRINRNQLISDSNLDVSGSILEETQNPVKIVPGFNSNFLESRVGNGGNIYSTSRMTPRVGYCLRFDKNNQSAYIQTTIPSTEYSNYDIIIKGEGTVDILYPDHSSTNIAIKQKSAITDTGWFNLSYIAFRNKTTKKIEHLFECEENTGTILYDAVTGDTATLESVTSISLMRINDITKEWIKDESVNLINRVDYSNEIGEVCQTTTACLANIPTRTYCMTLEFPEDQETNNQVWCQLIGDNFYSGAYYGNNISVNYNGTMYSRYGNGTVGGLAFGYRNNDPYVNELFGEGDRTSSNRTIIRKGKYKCVFTVYVAEQGKTSSVKMYVNGDLKHTAISTAINTSSVKWVDGCTLSMFTVGNFRNRAMEYPRSVGNTQYGTLVCGCYNVHVFSFEVTDSSPYTIQDYQNDIIPEYNMDGLIYSSGNITMSKYKDSNVNNICYWGDRSINNNTMKFTGPFMYSKSKCYGTWLNNVGFTQSGSLYIPRKVIA